jgi:hypothetical protein
MNRDCVGADPLVRPEQRVIAGFSGAPDESASRSYIKPW